MKLREYFLRAFCQLAKDGQHSFKSRSYIDRTSRYELNINHSHSCVLNWLLVLNEHLCQTFAPYCSLTEALFLVPSASAKAAGSLVAQDK